MRSLKFVMVAVAVTMMRPSIGMAQEKYIEPRCELNTGHFLVNSSVVYIKGASDEADSTKRATLLASAERNLVDALGRGQQENPAVWYFLGRYYEMVHDVPGADSAFQKTDSLAPQCADDVDWWRRYMWVPIINEAMDSLRAGAFNGARDLLRSANLIYTKDNIGLYYLARVFGNDGELDSAIYYFKKVVALGEPDTARYDNYKSSMYNVGLLYSMSNQPDSAAVWFRRYRDVDPSDMEALSMLATAFDDAGKPAEAMALYDSILTMAPQVSAMELFKTGGALFRADRYDKAVRAFELGLGKNKYYRPALYNLANSCLALANDDSLPAAERTRWARRMESAARQLVTVDPLNTESLRLLAAAFQLQRKDDSTQAVLQRIGRITYEVTVDVQQPGDESFQVQGRITNRKSTAVNVPTLTFEFLDGAGNVVTTATLSGQTLDPAATTQFQMNPTGKGIEAVRYKAPAS